MNRTMATGAAAAIGLAGLALAIVADAAGRDDLPQTAAARELYLPSDWAGEWSFRFDTRDPVTGHLSSREEGTTGLCPGDQLGLSMYVSRSKETRCEGSIDDESLGLTCGSAFVHGSCRIDFSVDVAVARDLDTLTGAGEWRVVQTAGDCHALLDHAATGESIRLTGTRIDRNPGGCTSPPASLIEKMLGHPELMALAPPPIAGLIARADGPTVGLTWKAAPKAKAYEIQRAVGGGRFKPIAQLVADRTWFHDTSIERGREYRYAVRWITPDGRVSPMSTDVSVTP
jgi:hypothetical protein